jgi:hypothetical protein
MLILGGDKANLASTRMVTNMTIKHLTPAVLAQLEGIARAAVPGAVPPPVAPPAPLPAPRMQTQVPFPSAAPAPVAAPAVAAAPIAVAKPAVVAPAPEPVAETATKEPAKVRMYRGRPY